MTLSPAVSRPSRRAVITMGAAAVLATGAGGAVFGARWFNTGARLDASTLSVTQAHELATAGQIVLIDIRRPDEWNRTGIGAGAVPLDMRRPDFVTELQKLAAGHPGKPVALICARGVRSRHVTQRLTEAGVTGIVDVPEGMLGSGAGPGWLRTGLPVVFPE